MPWQQIYGPRKVLALCQGCAMVRAGFIQSLWRYPVKSMAGEEVASLEFDDRGAVGDRIYAVYHPDGKFGSGKNSRRFRRMDGLLDCHASYDGSVPVVRLPDGTCVRGGEAAADAALAGALGLPGVRIAREAAVPHLDAAPVHLVTTSSLAWLRERLPDAVLGVRRFRPNLVVDVPGAGRVEDAWVGRTVAVGEVRLRIVERTERCVMVNAAQPGHPADSRVLRTLADRTDLRFGVYADVVTPGTIHRGDRLAVA
jgi:uncharacterized protein YcbX